jgi:hypothetical protein
MAKYADKDLAVLLTHLEETIYGGKALENSLYKNIASSSEKLRRHKNKLLLIVNEFSQPNFWQQLHIRL